MCGRFLNSFSNDELNNYLKKNFNLKNQKQFNLPNYNVSPGMNVISLISDGKNYRVGELNWGFIPKFSKPNNILKIINSRSESVFIKPSFKNNIIFKRCVVLADGFYEWDYDKDPYLFKVSNQEIFPFAGIYESYQHNNETLHTVSLITLDSNKLLSDIHQRMPLILNEKTLPIWLNPNVTNKKEIENTFIKYDSNLMKKIKISKLVNNTKNNNPNIITPIT